VSTPPERSLLPPDRGARLRRLLDGLLLVLLAAVAFLLGCYEMGDTDVWWHLRGGQWILEHGRVPHLDPFTFGSADRLWVDVHWSYEVVLALAYDAGGVGALVLLGALAGGGAFVAGLGTRRREWPVVVAVLCWLPALVLFAFRLDPRPEVFSLLYLGCVLAVLSRAERRPALLWLLPLVQVLWVNTQGLFVFGPILVALYATARGAVISWQYLSGSLLWGEAERRWWRHLGGAGLAVVAACFLNPYGLDGVRFPFDLYPKVADPNNPYKKYIDELQSATDYVTNATVRVAGTNWFFLALYLLLLLLPVSFLYPALWRAWQEPAVKGRRGPGKTAAEGPAVGVWLGGLAALVGLLALHTLLLSGAWAPAWVVALGDNVSILILVAAAGVGWLWRERSRPAALLVLVGGAALAAWVGWLQAKLLGAGRAPLGGALDLAQVSPLVVAGLAAAGLLVLRRGGDLFRMLLAGAFSYLALQAMQNWSRFALVAGVVLAWNFGAWAVQLRGADKDRDPLPAAAGWWARGGLLALLSLWLCALLTDSYYVHTGEVRHFAFREEPFAVAHEAAVFAGRPGLPERALVYGLGETGTYVFHNAPRCKPFMDGRLEMPAQQTFETYRDIENWLRDNDPRWEKAVAGMGNPLLLLEHANNYGSEAHLLTHPDWRCIYYDALAAVFIHEDRAVMESAFPPTVDFAARHFQERATAPIPNLRRAAAREEKALANLGASLPPTPEAAWRWRIPVLLAALDRAGQALDEDPTRAESWILLGNCYRNLRPDLKAPAPTPARAWHPEEGIPWVQATYCFKRALEQEAGRASTWHFLHDVYAARVMLDAQVAAGKQWVLLDPRAPPRQRDELLKLSARPQRRPPVPRPEQLAELTTQLVRDGRSEAAARVLQEAESRGSPAWSWAFAEQAAGLYMHLGRPADARRAWEAAADCPSEALRRCRVAGTFWVERDFAEALRLFEEARDADPQSAEACWGLAMLHAQLGDAGPALAACTDGLRRQPNERQRADLEGVQQLVRPYQTSR
jgi:tetratricopeptide (TPR) repeat protein